MREKVISNDEVITYHCASTTSTPLKVICLDPSFDLTYFIMSSLEAFISVQFSVDATSFLVLNLSFYPSIEILLITHICCYNIHSEIAKNRRVLSITVEPLLSNHPNGKWKLAA